MNNHRKKMIAPIIVTIIMVLYYIAYFAFIMSVLPRFWKYVFGIFPIIISAVTVYVCIERINEIKKGEEDDISKY